MNYLANMLNENVFCSTFSTPRGVDLIRWHVWMYTMMLAALPLLINQSIDAHT